MKRIAPFFYLSLAAFLTACRQGGGHERPLSAEVRFHNHRPVFLLNGERRAPVLYALTDVPGGRWSWEELPQHNIRAFCEQGIRCYQVDLFLEHVWPAPDSFSLEIARKQVRGVREACPEAAVFFRFHVNAPRWWLDRYPEEMVVYDSIEAMPDQPVSLGRMVEADPRAPRRHSLASRSWLTSAGEKLAQFCRAFSQTPEGDALAGLQVASGVYGEWHQWGILKYEADLSRPMREHFREWLGEKYGSDEALRAAWGDPSVRLDSVRAPVTAERARLSAGIFRHPVQDRKVIDYYQCQHELVADDIVYFCRTVKENWPRPIITGAFYGYFFSVFNRQAVGGHLALHRVLRSEYVDYLSGPQAYYPESGDRPGEPYRSRSLIHSVWLNGKLWLDEYDQQPKRTWPYLATIDNRERYEQTVRDNVSQIRRNVLFPLLKGQGLWFYDFGPAGMHLNRENERNDQAGTAGYWDHPVYLENIGRLKAAADSLLDRPYRSNADVLAVYDTESILYMPSVEARKCPVTEHLINWSTLALYYAGVVFDPIHLDDLERADLSAYRAVIFFNTFVLDDRDRQVIREKVAMDGRHVVWIYAPGYINGPRIDPALVADVTGFQLDTLRSEQAPELLIDPALGEIPPQVAKGPYDPVFYLRDEQAEVLGRYKGLDEPGFGRKEGADHVAWYIGVPPTDHRLFQYILDRAGARVYSREKEIVYAGGDLLMWHTTRPGLKRIGSIGAGEDFVFEVRDSPATVLLDLRERRIVLEE